MTFADSPARGGWRLASPADVPFVYDLVTKVDPRWWRFSRGGLEPTQVLRMVETVAAGAIVHDDDGRPVACALLAEAGASGTGMFEYFALPEPHAEELAIRFAPDLVTAAFDGAAMRIMYHERFEGDPQLLGEVAELFHSEVVYPDFAWIDGRLEARTISALTAERFEEWRAERSAE